MRIFSLDTSFSFLNFSVIEDGKVTFIYYLDSKRKTLELLPNILEENGIDLSSFSGFAVSKGIGYLTSLRIGITFMKTWAYIYNVPLIAFENLKLMALYSTIDYPKVPYLKVSSYIFYQIFHSNNEHSDIKIFSGETIEGVGITLPFWNERICKENIILEFFPFSAYGGLYAYNILKEGKSQEDIFGLEPIYIR